MSEVLALGDVADVVAGVGFPKEMQGGQDGAIPVFKVGDISAAWLQGKSLLNDSRNYLSAEEAKSLGKCVPAGATVFAKIGEALRLNRRVMLGRDALVDNNVMGLVPRRERVAPKYLYYFMQTVDLGGLSRSTTVPSIRKSDVVEINIPVPALAVQDEMVAELEKQFSRLDETVANLQRVKANLKRYKASVLKAAVEGRLVETEAALARREGRPYETGEQLLQRILEERRGQWQKKTGYKEPSQPALADQSDLPDGWVWGCVEQLNPGNRPCAYGVLQPGEDLANGVPFVRVGDINDGTVDFTDMKRIHPNIAAAYPRTYLKGGEVLLTLVGAIGRTAVAPSTLAGANVARAVGVLPINESINPQWVEMWFRNPAKIAEMTGKSHEVARKTLNLEDVRLAAVALPPRTEQTRIVAEVDRHLSIIREVEAEVDANLQRAQALRQATLSKAFSGVGK